MAVQNDQRIWHDRKRFWGMPLSFTRYSISDDRLFMSIGFLTIHDEEVLLYRIRDISSSRSLWQRVFGVGTITVASSDKSTPSLVIKNVKNPMYVKELLHKQVEEAKLSHRVRFGEVMTTSDDDESSTEDDEL